MAEGAVSSDPLGVRSASLRRLADEPWDVLVIGGGIVGAGALLDAASRGLSAALIERDDLAIGTSSRSSRLIHGGLRYLEDLRFGLVREALAERSRLLRLAPHLVRLEPFLLPVYGWPLVHRAFYGSGLVLYDLLGAARDGGRARHLDADAVTELAPAIRRRGLHGGVTYHDGVEDDARYAIAVARTAMARGAELATRVRADELLLDDAGRAIGVMATDLLADEPIEIRAGAVIDATGVWAGRPETRLGGSGPTLAPSRGTHVLFERDRIPLEMGMTLRVPGRVVFIVPWPDAWIVGTTDVADDRPPDRLTPTSDDVDVIIDNLNAVLDVGVTRDDVIGTYAGLRPLVGTGDEDSARVSREHTVSRDASGLVRVAGGKYTTYRLMARDAVDIALTGRSGVPASATAELPLIGAAARAALDRLASTLVADGLDQAAVRSLIDRHGTEASDIVSLGHAADLLGRLVEGLPYLEAEVVHAVRHEAALDLDDVLSRRLRLSTVLRDRGEAIAPRVAELVGRELGWDGDEQARRVTAYLAGARREYGLPEAVATPADGDAA